MEASNGDNDFTWIDGTSVAETFSVWAYGEPNYPGVDENCAYMYVSGSKEGEWNNNPCDQPHHIVCTKQKQRAYLSSVKKFNVCIGLICRTVVGDVC